MTENNLESTILNGKHVKQDKSEKDKSEQGKSQNQHLNKDNGKQDKPEK